MNKGLRDQGTALFTSLLWFVGIGTVIQLWLVTSTLEAMMAHDHAILVPAALTSLGVAAVNIALLEVMERFERRVRANRDGG